MKKILSILIVTVLFGTVVFAQEAMQPAFKGEATLSWGMDLGSGTNVYKEAKISHGFKNEAKASVIFPIFAGDKSGEKKGGENDSVYVTFDIKNADFSLIKKTDGSKDTFADIGKLDKYKNPVAMEIEASIHFYGLYLTVYNAPSMETSFAHKILYKDYKLKTGLSGKYGTKLGYANKDLMDLDVGLKFVSNGSWEDRDTEESTEMEKVFVATSTGKIKAREGYILCGDTGFLTPAGGEYDVIAGKAYAWFKVKPAKKDINGKYGIGLDFKMSPVEKFFTVEAKVNGTICVAEDYKEVYSAKNDKNAVGFGLKLSSEPMDGLKLDLGFDGGSTFNVGTKDIFAWALGFGTEYKNETVGTFKFAMYVGSEATPYGKARVESGLPKPGTDMAVRLGYEGLTGLVPGLEFKIGLGAYKLLSTLPDVAKEMGYTLPMDLHLGLAYKAMLTDAMSIKPYADIWGATNSDKYLDATALSDRKAYFAIAYKLGVEFMPMERLTVDAHWEHGKKDKDTGYGISPKLHYRSSGMMPAQHKVDNGRFILSAKVTF